mmetsp:Transcript_670/g.919  ORF Transcript_670/g.919 Transcript_670/m.919 type:complete len:81 (+) Transcript_670:370-612(+)
MFFWAQNHRVNPKSNDSTPFARRTLLLSRTAGFVAVGRYFVTMWTSAYYLLGSYQLATMEETALSTGTEIRPGVETETRG